VLDQVEQRGGELARRQRPQRQALEECGTHVEIALE
jgi:hypothetical protein